MPSPCEFVPEQDAEVIHYGQAELPPQRGSATRVIPAVVGGLFAGLLLVGLGCTPLFKPQASKARPESGTIVTASRAAGSIDGVLVVGGQASKAPARESAMPTPGADADATSDIVVAAPSSSAAIVSGVPAIASSASTASSSAAPAAASMDSHRFAVICDPPHGREDRSVARPETVTLQGIMVAGQSSKAALMNGTLYREGDRFGSALCPWTVAMIDAAGVRIEKAFGDRVCGVTIQLQNAAKPQVANAPALSKSAKPRSATMSNAKSR